MGLTLIGSGKHTNYRSYKFDGCGHEQEIKTGAVRVGGFLCRKCEETCRLKPSKIYLIKLGKQDFQWLKLGYSNNISERLKRYGLGTDISARILRSLDVETGEKAHFYENEIQKKYRKKS